MSSFPRVATALSSAFLRSLVFLFLRWIPGHHTPPIIYSLFAIYVISFNASVLAPSRSEALKNHDYDKTLRKPTHQPNGLSNSTAHRHVRETQHDVNAESHLQIFKTLMTGLPSSTSLLASIATFLINSALVLMVVLYVYAPTLIYPSYDLSMARVGYVSESRAKIFLREPDPLQLPITLSYRYADTSEPGRAQRSDFGLVWATADQVVSLNDETDFTATLTISNLEPDTRYQYALSNSHNGFFITAPGIGTVAPRGNGKFNFLHTSCIIQNFPYDPLAHPLSIRGFRHLSRWLPKLRPAFILFLGDFIYADVPVRHGADTSTYRKHYRHIYASPDWPLVAKTAQIAGYDGKDYDIPWLHTYDDHEIENDWSKNTTGYFRVAFDPYLHYHLNPNPPLPQSPAAYPPGVPGEIERSHSDLALKDYPRTYTSFTQGPAMFFFLDLRRYRQPPSQHKNTTMLGPAQLSALLSWLSEPPPSGVNWKILVSSVPFTKNWRVNAQDTWAGYLTERRKILEAMWDYGSSSACRIIILSGDRHEFAATAFPPPHEAVAAGRWSSAATIHEFSTSPLSQFYLPVRTYKQDDESSFTIKVLRPGQAAGNDDLARKDFQEEDVCLKYIPEGNSKFGSVEIEAPTGSGISLLRYRLFVDGVEAWSHILSSGGPDFGAAAATLGKEGKRAKQMWKEGIWE